MLFFFFLPILGKIEFFSYIFVDSNKKKTSGDKFYMSVIDIRKGIGNPRLKAQLAGAVEYIDCFSAEG